MFTIGYCWLNKLFHLIRKLYTSEETFFEFGVAYPEGCASAINWDPNKINLIEHYTFLAVYEIVPLKN